MRHFVTLCLMLFVLLVGGAAVLAAADAATVPATTPAPPAAAPVQPAAPAATTNTAQQLVMVSGKISQIKTPKKADGMVTATLTTDTLTVHVSLAPQSYLEKIGLTLLENDDVTITGQQHISKKDQSITLNIQVLKLGEKTYQLRDVKDHALWQPKQMKITGTVKDLTTPDAAAVGDARMVCCTLETDDNPLTVRLAPSDYLTAIGLSLKNGDTMSLEGTVDTTVTPGLMLAYKVKWHGVPYTLRDKKGTALWGATPATVGPAAPKTGTVTK